MNKGIWTPFFKHCHHNLPAHVQLCALDLLEEETAVDKQTFNIDYIVKRVSHSLRPNTVLVGWSMGGLVAQKIVNNCDERLIGHVQIGSTPKFLQTDGWAGIKPEVLKINNLGRLKS